MNKKKRKKVLVVLGGTSGERAVSLESGKACVKALKKKNYIVSTLDPKHKHFNLINKKKVDIIFNALHGKEGEDGVAQSYFEYLRIPYTHSGVISSYNSMDKVISKKIFLKNKIITPNYFVIQKDQIKTSSLKNKFLKKNFSFPIVIKPINEGSSLGVKIAKNFVELKKFTKFLFKKYKRLMFEQYIGGQEVQVAIINNKPALKAHLALSCKGVTRTDFKFFKNKFYLLELNTQPGMTSLSLVPEIASYYGISFENLVEKILLDASINR